MIVTGVVPEYQCAVKREQKKQQKEKDKPNSTTQSPTPKADIDIKVHVTYQQLKLIASLIRI